MLLTLAYLVVALFRGPRAPANPWDSRSYEWYTPSPPPTHNFAREPVFALDPYDYTVPFPGDAGLGADPPGDAPRDSASERPTEPTASPLPPIEPEPV